MRIEFANAELLYLLLLIPAWFLLVSPRTGRSLLFTRGESARRRGVWFGARALSVLLLPRILRAATLAALVLALADPQRLETVQDVSLVGKGIGLAVDLSSSMLAADMGDGQSRIEIARQAAVRFAENRPLDEMSLVGFAGEAVTRVPPTDDPQLIVAGVESLEVQLVRDGTDISAALLTSVARLHTSEREPRVVVLLTDGAHNGVRVPPLAAARAAAALDVRVHAISVLGPPDTLALSAAARATLLQRQGQTMRDMRTVLQGIAEITGGRYFHASNAGDLEAIYEEIDRIEQPTEDVSEREVRHSERRWLLLLALALFGSEALLRGSRWSVVP